MVLMMLSTIWHMPSVQTLVKVMQAVSVVLHSNTAIMRIGGKSLTLVVASFAARITSWLGCSGATATRSTVLRWPSAAKSNGVSGTTANGLTSRVPGVIRIAKKTRKLGSLIAHGQKWMMTGHSWQGSTATSYTLWMG